MEGCGAAFVTPIRVHRKYNISIYFLRKIISHFPLKEKISFFREKIPSFQIIQERSWPSAIFLKRPSFQDVWKLLLKDHLLRTFEENIIFLVFFWERSSFIFCLRGDIIFSGERNIIFPDNTRKIIFQRNFFEKTIFSGCLEKENMVFRAVLILPISFFAGFNNLVVARFKKFSLGSINGMKLLLVSLISILSMTLASLACLIPSLFIFAAVGLLFSYIWM